MTGPGLVRSYLYVPGTAADKLAKARGRGADALIVDLEDAVPLAEKDRARAAVLDWLSDQPEVGSQDADVRPLGARQRGRAARSRTSRPSPPTRP